MNSFDFNSAGSPRVLSEIRVTALVDVMTVLLIIFMITTPMIQSGVQVDLPRASAAAPDLGEGLVITITSEGSLYLEDRLLSIAQFDGVFGEIFEDQQDKPVFIRGDEQVPYGAVIGVLDKLKQHGVTQIGLATSLRPSR
ncbi:MAG: biopolymer transporter ExbD [Gemmatimonadetes bacterium]|nr:biopolymer transporter ExbD [candidate division Zixibacteria bacterium]MDE2846453.1 biopolymer transporter ExbD [Gemmatimonadota bacterium]MDE2847191.1 biopolymer transporter ExbD [Gemmatimonadota bacterium]MDE2848907.1 biopolymer transporter ExbD [Gemmatimonadota bacterium]MXX03766.1 biopolymer transporter ExbD [Gemmatimonadota bacterium]